MAEPATRARGSGEPRGVECGWWGDECVVRARGVLDIVLASEANTDAEGAGEAIVGLPIAAVGGFMRFSFCRLQCQSTKLEFCKYLVVI